MTATKTTAVIIPAAQASKAAPFAIRAERGTDVAAREALLDVCFGEDRFARTCQRLRDGRKPAEGLAFVAVQRESCRDLEGNVRNTTRMVGSVRLWHVSVGGRPALLLGPLAVDPACRKLGLGAALIQHALTAAGARGHGAVILLGDAPYYARFGFSAEKTFALALPGPFERDRLLARELRAGALDGVTGTIAATGAAPPRTRRVFRLVAAAAPHAA